ncbi:Fermitin family like protein 2 [Eufriesea mexicana]|nr:Fermitin family like protein 2 [Eufriesea mexicana]
MYSDGHEVDGSWVLRVYVTDLQMERSLRIKGELHIGGVMLRLVEDLVPPGAWSHALLRLPSFSQALPVTIFFLFLPLSCLRLAMAHTTGSLVKILGARFLSVLVRAIGTTLALAGFTAAEKQSPAWPGRRKVTGPQVPMFIVGCDTYHSVGDWTQGRKKKNAKRSERRERERERELGTG